MTTQELGELLAKHQQWLDRGREGEGRAILDNMDLHDANLAKANLSWASLRNTNLSEAYLKFARLQDADLTGANLREAYVGGGNFKDAILDGAKLSRYNIIPVTGSFIAYKAVRRGVIELEIMADAQRTSCLDQRKCRADKVLVLRVVNGDNSNLRS